MAERARRKRTVRGLLGVAGAFSTLSLAGAALFTVGATNSSLPSTACSGACTEVDDAPPVGRAGASSYPPGSRIRAGDTPLSVSFGALAKVDVSANSEVVYQSQGGIRRFRLVWGSVRMDVERLEGSQRFIVDTPDTEVEVRGTRFEVAWLAPDLDCASRTRVDVSEGDVEVRSHGAIHALTAGRSWLGECRRPAIPVASSSVSVRSFVSAPKPAIPHVMQRRSERAVEGPAPEEPSPVASSVGRSETPASNLSDQNQLYGRAIAARRAGQLALALSLHEQLIRQYPGGPLAESALIERVRMLMKADRARAATEARRYLDRFPHGFARDEARSIAAP